MQNVQYESEYSSSKEDLFSDEEEKQVNGKT